jgi:RNA polymerase sigma factor (TIGR02999 family)
MLTILAGSLFPHHQAEFRIPCLVEQQGEVAHTNRAAMTVSSIVTKAPLGRGSLRMSEITRILNAIEAGEPHAADQLLPLVYDELRKLAAQRLIHEKPGQTLQATALVHEAYLRLVDGNADQQWNSKGHFFAAAAEAMRRILIDKARHKQTLKAGGGKHFQELPDIAAPDDEPGIDLLALDEALQKLEKQDERRAKLVKLRFFARLTIEQASEVLGIATSTAQNDWAYARYWLRLEIEQNKLNASS